jgi:orotidine-5'-phosphate decarboxylase
LKSPIVVALDFGHADDAIHLARRLDPQHCRLKVGKELFTAAGPSVVEVLQSLGFEVFLDLKFHDIPNTVASALASAQALGVWMVNIHASGGPAMLDAARRAIDGETLLTAVTVLTSMDAQQLAHCGVGDTLPQQVLRLARLSYEAGLDGVVCSPQESSLLKAQFADFQLVTPGVRPAGAQWGDQSRVMTPFDAMAAGSDFLVIGRPISQAPNPSEALDQIINSLDQ